MRRRRSAFGARRLLDALGLAGRKLAAADPRSLRGPISLRFPGIAWVTTAELAGWLEDADGRPPMLLDARSSEEYAVSRLADAIRVNPSARRPTLDDAAADRHIVVYCSVGYRSGAMTRRLRGQGFERVYNLEGGIFAWANEGRPIVGAQGEETGLVHPFSRTWQRYLEPARRSYDGVSKSARPRAD